MRGGRQGRAGAAGGVRPRRRGRRWLKKTFSVALAERRSALWVEVRRTEAAGRAGVEGEVGRCRARTLREASLTEGLGGREQPQRGAGRAAEGRGDLAPLATLGDGAATPTGTGAEPSAYSRPSLRLVCPRDFVSRRHAQKGGWFLRKLDPRTPNLLSAPSCLSGIVVQHQGSPLFTPYRQREDAICAT